MAMWDGSFENFGAMVPEQRTLFVDPGLYEGRGMHDEAQLHQSHRHMSGASRMTDNDDALSRPSTRRTSSSKSETQRTTKSNSTDITPPEQESHIKKGKAKRKRKIEEPASSQFTEEDQRKRNKFLERNRVAASKCREKKKQYMSDLEETKIGLETRNVHLHMEYNSLISEARGLKHQLMAHAKCNDQNITCWINKEARRFVQTPTELYGQPFDGSFGQAGQAGLPLSPPGGGGGGGGNPGMASAFPGFPTVPLDGIGPSDRPGSFSHGQFDMSIFLE